MLVAFVLAGASITGLVYSWNRGVDRQTLEPAPSASSAQLEESHRPGASPDMRSLSAIKLIDINNADQAQLQLLPGIGPALAGRIVDDRDEHGRFDTIEALDRVPGIGPKTIDKVRDSVVVGD